MISGVYIGRSSTGSYDLISTGDFINPVYSTFKLRDERTSVTKEQQLYLVINDISVEYIQVLVTGRATAIRTFVSWNGDQWFDSIRIEEEINNTGITTIKPFKVRFVVDDFLEYFNITQQSSYKQYKLKLMYA